MNSPQQSLASPHSSGFERGDTGRWSVDDDIPLGCESADPTLQIERWGQEAPAFLPDTY